MNFLAQATPLTPNKHRSSMGLFASELSLSPLDCTPHHPQNQNEEACTTPPRGSPNKVSRTPPTSSSKPDRFIPNRNNIDFDYCHNQLFCHAGFDENIWNEQGSHETPRPTRSSMTATEHMLNAEVLRELQTSSNKRMMSFANNHDSATSPPHTGSPLGLKRPLSACLSPKLSSPHKKSKRMLPAGPCKILDAPGLRDDYYLNLLSWGSNNIIAIALHNAVYLWNASDGNIEQLVQLTEPDDYITSVQWGQTDNTLAVGTNGNMVEIWDSEKLVKTRELPGHTSRVSALSWNNSHALSSGGRDSAILNHDLRASRHVQSTYLGHQQEVCGLAWSPDGGTLASGGNENLLCIWDAAMSSSNSRSSSSGGRFSLSRSSSTSTSGRSRVLNQSSSTPRHALHRHQAAVKALAWCPWQRDVLASGGGTADRSIRLWNSSSGVELSSTDTGSQVCAMQWSEQHRELVSSHGFSDNQLCLWKLASSSTNSAAGGSGSYNYGSNSSYALVKQREFRSHSARVLHMAKSPDGTRVVTAGADESLRFWDLFGPNEHRGASGSAGAAGAGGLSNLRGGTGGGLRSSLGGVGGMSMGASFSLR